MRVPAPGLLGANRASTTPATQPGASIAAPARDPTRLAMSAASLGAPLLRQGGRLLRLRAQAALVPLPEPPRDPQAVVGDLLDGLRREAWMGCSNALGDLQEQRFSDFAAQGLEQLLAGSQEGLRRVELHRAAKSFRRYARLDLLERQRLLQDTARRLNSGERLTFLPAAAPVVAEKPRRSARKAGSSSGGGGGRLQANAAAALPDTAPAAAAGGALLEAAAGGSRQGGSEAGAGLSRQEAAQARQESFLAAARRHEQAAAQLLRLGQPALAGEQRTAEWHALRDGRLTASAFGNALGFWAGGRERLWEEKLGLRQRFAGNEATAWGTNLEDEALARYEAVSRHRVSHRAFSVLGSDHATSWLGASPDGLVEAVPAAGGSQAASPYSRPPRGKGPGVLEIKCPFNRGEPLRAQPHSPAPWYYMPQVQGLLEIFDREWCNIFSYTVNGASLQHIPRDRRYWRDCYAVLADFWWAHLVPAKHALAAGDAEAALALRPPELHGLTQALRERSKAMVQAADCQHFPPDRPARP